MSKDTGHALDARVVVAISTVADRLHKVNLPAGHPAIKYLVLVQGTVGAPPSFERPDVECVALGSTGLSNSRNAALVQGTAPYVVFADDDLTLDVGGLLDLADRLDQNSDHCFATGWRAGRDHLPTARRVRWYNSGHICAPELMVRRDAIDSASVMFDPNFGVGAKHPIGEDFIFVMDMLKAGCVGWSYPIVTGAHDGQSTGDIWQNAEILTARRMMIGRSFGAWAPMARIAYALKHRHNLGGWMAAARFATWG